MSLFTLTGGWGDPWDSLGRPVGFRSGMNMKHPRSFEERLAVAVVRRVEGLGGGD